MPNLFDIDAEVAAYQPIHIKFRGQEYVLGATTMQVLLAMEVIQADEIGTKQLVENLPAILRTMCPKLDPVLKDKALSQAEEVALLKPVTAVMNSFTALTKSDDAETEEPA